MAISLSRSFGRSANSRCSQAQTKSSRSSMGIARSSAHSCSANSVAVFHSIGISRTRSRQASATSRRSTSTGPSCNLPMRWARPAASLALSRRSTSTSDGLSLSFKQGQASAVQWRARAGGRELDVDLFFNRTFLVSAQPRTESSWSRGMRPDASVRVRPLSHLPDLTDQGDLDLWLHFDAKYRLEAARDQFARASADDAEAAQEAEVVERTATTKREDLLKMHAYRDAIRRSAGAYVLYPGDDRSPPFREFAEVLPGLGAFVLRPGSVGEAQGRAELNVFLEAVLMHAAERASQHERDRYWRARVYAAPRVADGKSSRLPDLTAPPRDTLVLCGYLRSERHERWVRRVGTYNVRAGDRRGALGPDASELRAEWLLLYRDNGSRSLWIRDGSWFVQTREQLIELGYPNPRGPVYLCAPVVERVDAPSWLDEIRVEEVGTGCGARRAPRSRSHGGSFSRPDR